MSYFKYLANTSFGRCYTGEVSLPKIGSKLAGTTLCILKR